MKLIVLGSWFGVENVFSNMFGATLRIGGINELEKYKGWFDKNAVILFGGGADISPSIYGQEPTRFTGATEALSVRDEFELAAFRLGMEKGAKFLGVCRGAQLLCATSGGTLYQHVDNHAGEDHTMETEEGTVLYVSSAHHQMMNPHGTKHKLLAWSADVRSDRHIVEDDVNVKVEVEPEVVFFEDTKALAIQYHPEFMKDDAPAVKYSRDLVKKYLMEA